jgi:hypothetical protein
MMNDRDYVLDADGGDYIDAKKEWICQRCYTRNWFSRNSCRKVNCSLPKKIFEPVSDSDWIKSKDKYSRIINDTKKWNFSKLSNNIHEYSTIYDRIIALQQATFLRFAEKYPELKFAIDLDTVPKSAILYVGLLLNGDDTMDKNKIMDDIVDKYVSTLWINHRLLFLRTARANDENDVVAMSRCIKNHEEKYHYEKRYNVYDSLSYDESYTKIIKMIVQQFNDPKPYSGLCDRIRESIVKIYRQSITKDTQHIELAYPIKIEQHTGFIEDPFSHNKLEKRKNIGWVNDELELWTFVLHRYVYDDVKLCVEIIDSKNVRFCWTWTDHSW